MIRDDIYYVFLNDFACSVLENNDAERPAA